MSTNLFKIDGATGKVTLDTNKALDYETTPIHELTIQAADATTGTIKTDMKLTINVKNKAADGAITFANKTGSLNEDGAIGNTVGTMAATTADGSTISKFEIKSAAGSTTTDTKSKFDIDGESGEIRFGRRTGLRNRYRSHDHRHNDDIRWWHEGCHIHADCG